MASQADVRSPQIRDASEDSQRAEERRPGEARSGLSVT